MHAIATKWRDDMNAIDKGESYSLIPGDRVGGARQKAKFVYSDAKEVLLRAGPRVMGLDEDEGFDPGRNAETRADLDRKRDDALAALDKFEKTFKGVAPRTDFARLRRGVTGYHRDVVAYLDSHPGARMHQHRWIPKRAPWLPELP